MVLAHLQGPLQAQSAQGCPLA